VEELSFEQIQKRLTEQFLREERGVETDEELGNAVLDLILQSERLRHNLKGPGPEQEKVDRQTLERLYHQTELGPEHFFAEGIFRRLVKDPASAMRHFREAVETQSARQAKRANSPRRKDALGKVIDALLDYTPDLTEPKLRDELNYRRWSVNKDEIRSPEGEQFPPNCLKDRLYRAKKEAE
jgi:hypothetical protein